MDISFYLEKFSRLFIRNANTNGSLRACIGVILSRDERGVEVINDSKGLWIEKWSSSTFFVCASRNSSFQAV